VKTLAEAPQFIAESDKGEECKCGGPPCNTKGPHMLSSGNDKAGELAEHFQALVGHNLRYAIKQGVAEWLCLVVCALQILITNSFLGDSFLEYGPKVILSIKHWQ